MILVQVNKVKYACAFIARKTESWLGISVAFNAWLSLLMVCCCLVKQGSCGIHRFRLPVCYIRPPWPPHFAGQILSFS